MRVRERSGTTRIAAVAPNWLGDAVMCLPALHQLADAPGVSLSILASPYVARVFLHNPAIDALFVDAVAGRAARIRSRTHALRAMEPGAAVMFPPSFSSALPAWFARVPFRVGFRADGRHLLLTHGIEMPSRANHLTDSYGELSRAALGALGRGESAGTKSASAHCAPRLVVTEGERESVRARLGAIARDGYVVVVPGAAFGPAKAWPEERYRALCAALVRDTAVVLSGSRADRVVCDRIRKAVPDVLSLAGDTTLGEMFALVEGARVLVANDSGAPHVAAALGVSCVVLFGSTSPAWTAPRGDVRVMQHKVHCNPCFRRTCPTRLECFNGIGVEEVRRAVLDAVAVQAKKADAAGKGLG